MIEHTIEIIEGEGQPRTIQKYSETVLPTQHGEFRCLVYRDENGVEEVAMAVGEISGEEDVLCRVHSACLTSEVLGSVKCDCKEQLDASLRLIQKVGQGVVIYLHQEGRGIGLGNKIRAYAEQAKGHDTVDANRVLGLPDDTRRYDTAAGILKDLGIKSVALLTNNPLKIAGLEKHGVVVSRRVAHLLSVGAIASEYVKTKQERMGHMHDNSETSEVG